MADVEDAFEFLVECGLVVELGVLPVQRMTRRCIEAAFARTCGFVGHGIPCSRIEAAGSAPVGQTRVLDGADRNPLPRVAIRQVDQLLTSPSARVKRLACERSALARVSNQSAISSKPSSRAALAMPGYMSVYSWVSPAIADFRLLTVSPKGRPVAGSPTFSRYSRWPWAWPVSPSAVERNTAATSLWPSTSAFCAKYR